MYRYLLVDNDNTLMDFSTAEHHALCLCLAAWNVKPMESAAAAYSAINDTLWKALEKGETTLKDLKVERFRQLQRAFALEGFSPEAMADRYEIELGIGIALSKALEGKHPLS